MSKKYTIEREGQLDFFKNYNIPYEEDDSILVDNTDGVYNGVLLEFKLSINNLNSVLFQAIKYLSRMRIKGESVPRTILLIDLNNQKAYKYNSEDYLGSIEKEYIGAASKNNLTFSAGKVDEVFDYSDMVESNNLKKLLKGQKTLSEQYISINIDESCIVGWAERYYREKPKATKGDFLGDDEGQIKIIGEIRKPVHFKDLINPYTEETNEKFKYLMDCLNDRLKKKDLGAFYTPIPYAKKAAELVLEAVNRAIDAGKKDYIVLDRCGGSGNLESALIGLFDKNGDELISHVVVSTYEYYEYKVLSERLGDKVRDLIPPTEADVVYSNGTVSNADAMSEEYIDNPIIKGYIDDPDCAIIMFENPPYRDLSAESIYSGENAYKNKSVSYIFNEMSKDKNNFLNNNISTVRDIANQFIWSAFKYYLIGDCDSYILFSPVKYYKSLGIISKSFVKGYLFNRKHFHATASSISCIYWFNETIKREEQDKISLEVYDIVNDEVNYVKDVDVKTVNETFLPYFDKRSFNNDIETDVFSERDGSQTIIGAKKIQGKSYFNDNIVAYMRPFAFGLGAINASLLRTRYFGGRGFYLRSDNYLIKLPLFVAKLFPQDEWYEKDVYFTTSDGGDVYTKDKDFLKYCLIYTCLSNQNKCLSFIGSDNRYYKNELCFDEDTLASKDLSKFTLNKDEEELLELWNDILESAKKTKNYDSDLSYGVYQIIKELNTFKRVKVGRTNKKVYDYPDLNGDLETLRVKLKEYYKKYITDKMFEYELVK